MASSISSIQCRTGVRPALARWVWQPILAVAMTWGLPLSSAFRRLSRNWRASTGCVIEYVPAEPQHR